MTHSSCVLELEYGLSNLALKAQAPRLHTHCVKKTEPWACECDRAQILGKFG